MEIEIIDGTGSGNRAKVNEDKRVETFSVQETRISDISINKGQAYILTSDFINLTTTGSFSGIMYIKNTNVNKNLFIDKIRICGTGSSMGAMQCVFFKNPTAGTLISDANEGIVQTSNLGSNNVFSGVVYVASGDGKTVTDGDQFSQFTIHLPGHTTQEYDGALIIPNSFSLAILLKPSYATEACVEIQCWFEDK